MAGKNNRLGSKQIFATDPPKPLIGSLSHVVEHPRKTFVLARSGLKWISQRVT